MMKISTTFTILLGIVFALTMVSHIKANGNPGIQGRINSRGLVFAKDILVDVLKKKLKSAKIPNLSGNNYQLKNVQLTSFETGKTMFSATKPNVFSVTISGASLSARAKFKVWKKIGLTTFRKSGSITASASGVTITQSVFIDKNSAGKPTIVPGYCKTTIKKLRIKVKAGIIGHIANIVLSILKKPIRKKVAAAVCPVLSKVIKAQATKLTNNFNVNFPFIYGTNINLGLTRTPRARKNTLTVSLRGRCYRKTHPNELSPFPAPSVPSFSPCSKHAQVQVGKYALNTLFHSMWRSKRFNKKISSRQIRRVLGFNLNAGGLAKSVSSLKRFAKYRQLEIIITATKAPRASFAFATGIRIRSQFKFVVNVVLTNQRKQQAISTTVNVDIRGKVARKKGKKCTVSGSITSLAAVASSSNGFPVKYLNQIFDSFLPSLIKPAINEVTKSGFKVPSYFGYRCDSLTVKTKRDVIEICVDFKKA